MRGGELFGKDPEDDLCVVELECEAQEMSDIILRALKAALKRRDGIRVPRRALQRNAWRLDDWERELIAEACVNGS